MTTFQHVTQDEVKTDNFQRHITQFHENLGTTLCQSNHYAVELDVLDDFVNDNAPNNFEGKEDPYTGP